MARSTLWFATAYTAVIIVHECAHGLVAAALGLDATLFHFWVNIDRNNIATAWQRAAFGVAGPVSSLGVGVSAWLFYRGWRRAVAAAPLLLLTACGVSNFFGNLMSAAFIGDFSNVAGWLGLPMLVRYVMSALGAIAVAWVLFVSGRELRRWMPATWSRPTAALVGIVLPVALGTALVILINQPVAIPGFAASRAGEGVMWLFAAAGAALAPTPPADAGIAKISWLDAGTAVTVVAIVRLLVRGIPLS